MLKELSIPDVVELIQHGLVDARNHGAHLELRPGDARLEDDWLYVYLTPTHPGESASVHAALMAEIEKSVRDQGFDNVLLLPAIGD